MMNTKTTSQHITSLGERLEKTRLLQNISQIELAQSAGISERTLRRLESGQGGSIDSLIRLLLALKLDNNLLTLVPDHAVRPMERVRQAKTERQRASSSKKTPHLSENMARQRSGLGTPTKANSSWTWGDEQS